MRIAFFHDAPIKYVKKDNQYYAVGFDYPIWKRYLKNFSSLIIATRIKKYHYKNEIPNYQSNSVSSGKGVSFKPIESYVSISSLFKLPTIIKEINHVINDADGYILRLPSVIGFLAGMILIIRRKKFLVENVGCTKDSFLNKGDLISKLLAFPLYYVHKTVSRKSSVSIYITEKFLQSRYPTNGVQHGGVANVSFDFSNDHLKFINRKIERICSHKPRTIGLVGSLNVDYKGHKTAIDALKILSDKGYKDLKLEFVGPGSSKRWFNYAHSLGISENIIFQGELSKERSVYDWMKKLDIYIQPSTSEGHGRALVEAVYNGCVCFGTNIGGIPDTLNRDYLFNKEDVNKLVNFIIKTINDANYREANLIINFKNIKKYEENIIGNKRKIAFNSYIKILNEG